MTTRARPDPDALLERVVAEARRSQRGRLKCFLGAAPGVGKTFTMLEAAHLARATGIDVLVGVVETHGRDATARQLDGLPVLPRRVLVHRGAPFEEFDLDAALTRRPQLLLVDELAHTNVDGARHAKRWQDVLELVEAGIDVWTTCNVQHIESLNDVVAQITGVVVRETVPDQLFEAADELELVDVSPEVLEQRLRSGQVYRTATAEQALERFFRRGNLIALRELALRRVAQRVDADMAGYRSAAGIETPWRTTDRLLVVIEGSAADDSVVRRAAQLAQRLKAEWHAVYVETPGRSTDARRAEALDALDLAESLGATPHTIAADRVHEALLDFARTHNVSGFVVGRAERRWWQRGGDSTGLVVRAAVDARFDVHLVGHDDTTATRPAAARAPVARVPLHEYGTALLGIAVATAIGWLLRSVVSTADIAMGYLLAIVLVGTRARRGPAIVAALAATIAFDYLFVPPHFTLAVSDGSYLLTFAALFVVGLLIVQITSRLRAQTDASREREARTAALSQLSQQLTAARQVEEVADAAIGCIAAAVTGEVLFARPDANGRLTTVGGAGTLELREEAVARWVREHGVVAGADTDTLAAADHLWIPAGGSVPTAAVIGVRAADRERLRDPEVRRLLTTMARIVGSALDRIDLAGERATQQLEIEAERLRSSLLSSLSHDLRTPLASIEGAAGTLLATPALADETRHELAQGIIDESRRLARLVSNLLDMVRVESSSLMVHAEWQPVEEVIGAALTRLDLVLRDHVVHTALPTSPLMASFDAILIEQVLVNLLENAAKYAPAGTTITIGAQAVARGVELSVRDEGAGVPAESLERIFEKFERLATVPGRGGVGLGLTICRAIVQAHGGRIWAEQPPAGGFVVRVLLPVTDPPPAWAGATA